MFVAFYKHPLFNPEERAICRKRWTETPAGQETASRVLGLIREGAQEEFLNNPFYHNELPILENSYDLNGFRFYQVEQDFAGEGAGDNFKGIDFKHSQFSHCHFINAVFYSSSLEFVTLFNCTFERCIFGFTSFLGAKIERCKFIECDFVESCSFENVEILNSVFDKCFLGETTPFRECYFDDRTLVQNMKMRSYHSAGTFTPNVALAGYYASFQSAYEESGADELASNYFWKGRQAFTRHNSDMRGKVVGVVNELFTGYGVKPIRPIIAMLLIYAIATCLWTIAMPLEESILFTAGALFTFGAGSEHLKDFGCWARIVYAGLSFCGIVFSGLFVATLANLWFRQKIPKQTVKPR